MVVTKESVISVPNKWYTCETCGLSLPQGIQAWKVVSTELGTKYYHYYAKDGGKHIVNASGVIQYSAHDYRMAMALLPICFLVGLFAFT